MRLEEGESFVVADVSGLIPGGFARRRARHPLPVLKKLQAFAKRRRIACHVISAATRQGRKEPVYAVKKSLDDIERDGEATKRLVRRRPKKA